MTTVLHISWALTAVVLYRQRRQIVTTLRGLPVRYLIGVAVLLVVCAVIPGGFDDLIVMALVARMVKA